MNGGRVTVARELGRAGMRKVLQRTGIIEESVAPLSTDPSEVVQLLDAWWYEERLQKLAAELGRDPESVRAEAAGYLREMAASLDERAVQAWRGFSRWLMRAYDVLVDEDQIAALRKLDRKATLAFAFSHRSYLDGTLLPEVIAANRLTPGRTFGGWVIAFISLYSVWYVYKAMRAYYGQGRFLTLTKLCVVGFTYMIGFSITLLVTLLLSVIIA